jgi:hypothetical protein
LKKGITLGHYARAKIKDFLESSHACGFLTLLSYYTLNVNQRTIMSQPESVEISPELQQWLERRAEAIKHKEMLRQLGGHAMLNPSVVDPEELAEPLRTEALNYFDRQRHAHS